MTRCVRQRLCLVVRLHNYIVEQSALHPAHYATRWQRDASLRLQPLNMCVDTHIEPTSQPHSVSLSLRASTPTVRQLTTNKRQPSHCVRRHAQWLVDQRIDRLYHNLPTETGDETADWKSEPQTAGVCQHRMSALCLSARPHTHACLTPPMSIGVVP